MQWALLFVVVIALIFMSGRYPKVAFSLLAALAVAAVAIGIATNDRGWRLQQQIANHEVRIEAPVMLPGYGDSYDFKARLLNLSQEALLKEATIGITMLDCPGANAPESDCQVIGQSVRRIPIKIPAGQARDIERNVHFGTSRPTGLLRWKYAVSQTRS